MIKLIEEVKRVYGRNAFVLFAADDKYFRPSGDLARWSWLCYVLQEDGMTIPTPRK